MQTARSLGVLMPPDYLAVLEALLAIYAAAMNADQADMPSRLAIMERHAGNLGFRAIAATDDEQLRIVGFAYGFHGTPGQWWHDVVRSGLVARSGSQLADDWLGSVMEIAEVHVHPDYQAQGIGRQMMGALTEGRDERTAVLSTRDALTPARGLYHSLGFCDLLTDFQFPGGGVPYAVMGARLPLVRGLAG